MIEAFCLFAVFDITAEVDLVLKHIGIFMRSRDRLRDDERELQ